MRSCQLLHPLAEGESSHTALAAHCSKQDLSILNEDNRRT